MNLWLRARKRTHEVIEVAAGRDDPLSRLFDVSVMVLVAGNIIAVVLESVESLATPYADLFAAFESVSVAVFSAELVLRVWVAAERANADLSVSRSRINYVFSPMAIADCVAIAPYYLSSFLALDLRFLRLLRLLRVLKLTRYSGAFAALADVVKAQRGAFASAFMVLCLMLIFAASVVFVAEHEAQPEAFSSIPAAMWWAVATLTTVGYGDVAPITALGKLVASMVMILGIGMVALPTSILSSGFIELQQRRRRVLEVEAEFALSDGVFDPVESVSYQELAERLGVEPEEAQQIVDLAARSLQSEHDRIESCPHCGKGLEPD